MFCPETILVNRPYLYVVRHDQGDMKPCYMRWRDRLNPLRVEVSFRWGKYPNTRRFRVNRGGAANLWLSDLTWRLWRRKRFEARRDAE